MKFPNIHWALSERRIAQFQLADAIGWGESKFSRALSGRVEFTPEERMKIAEVLGFPEPWIFQEVVPPRLDGEAQPLGSVPVSS